MTGGRGHTFFEDAAMQECLRKVLPNLPQEGGSRMVMLPTDERKLPKAEREKLMRMFQGLSLFFLVPGKAHITTEYGDLGSLRLLAQGRRSVVLLPVTSVLAKYKELPGAAAGPDITLSDLRAMLHSANEEVIKDLCDKGLVH